LKQERAILIQRLSSFSCVKEILPSQANFLLLKTTCANELYDYLIKKNVVVRNRSALPLCEGGLRITVGTPEENKKLLTLLNTFEKPLTK